MKLAEEGGLYLCEGYKYIYIYFFYLAASVSLCATNATVETPYESKHCITLRTALLCHTHPRFFSPSESLHKAGHSLSRIKCLFTNRSHVIYLFICRQLEIKWVVMFTLQRYLYTKVAFNNSCCTAECGFSCKL